MWTATFWKQTAERAVKTFAQATVALLAGDGLGLLDHNWMRVAAVAGLAAVLSVFTSIGTSGIGQPDSPSAVDID